MKNQLNLFSDCKVKAVLKDSIKSYLKSQYKPFCLGLMDLEDKFNYYNRYFTEKLNEDSDFRNTTIYHFIHKSDHIHGLETMYEITIECFDIC